MTDSFFAQAVAGKVPELRRLFKERCAGWFRSVDMTLPGDRKKKAHSTDTRHKWETVAPVSEPLLQ